MFKLSTGVLLLAAWLLPFAHSYCPRSQIRSTGVCSFRVLCYGSIRESSLPSYCNGSASHPITIDLTLNEAVERFDKPIQTLTFLNYITTLRISATWPETDLALLEYTHSVQNLFLINNNIEKINGFPFYHLKNLEYVDLSYNILKDVGDLFQFESKPNNFTRLSLAYNAIPHLPAETFDKLNALKYLDLSYNSISDLNEDPFVNLTELVTLNLNNNNIKDLDGALNNLVSLKHLYLKGNKIQNINEMPLKIINKLETFDISGNQVHNLKSNIFARRGQNLNSICKIILAENHITVIPNANNNDVTVSRVTRDLGIDKANLYVQTELDLSKNAIDKIDYNAFRYTYQLISLDVSCNNLTDFLVNPFDVAHVRNLNLSSNLLTNLYFDSFCSMSNLLNLDLSHNNIHYISDKTFAKNYNLKHVNLAHNNLKVLDNLHINIFNNNGGVLDMSNNGLSKLHIPMSEGVRLTTLILHSNNIKDAAYISLIHQNQLKALSMNRNYIQMLNKSSIRLPSSLITLDISFNKLEKIEPSTFDKMHHLENLNLGHNKLKSIEFGALQGLSAAKKLDLSYNSISFLDSQVLMDLKSLESLSLQHNGLYKLDYNGWLGFKHNLLVYLEGNNYSCNWLGKALQDFNNGYSKMRPATKTGVALGNSIEGVPCLQRDKKAEELELLSSEVEDTWSRVLADERLLATNQKILKALHEQTYYLKLFLNIINSK